MTRIQKIQTKIGAVPDGRWGPRSQAALVAHLTAMLPNPYPFPKTYDEMFTFYGQPGDQRNMSNINTSAINLRFDGRKVNSVFCHNKIGAPLLEFFREVADSPFAYILERYDGCFNHRKMRGGSRWSDHAWAVAIDLDAKHNTLRGHYPVTSTMPLEVMEIAAKHGMTNLGWRANYDAMHFAFRLV